MATFKTGDRIAYAAKFLKNTGQFTGKGPQRRGTFLTYEDHHTRTSPEPLLARVRWDDFDFETASEYWGEDYAIDARDNGQRVIAHNIAKVGSARFALNDL